MLKHENAKLDLFGLLRLPVDDYSFKLEALIEVVEQLQGALIAMCEAGEVQLSEEIYWEAEQLIRDGLSHLGTYHVAKPLRFNKNGDVISESFKLLYFYHNRLEHYGLEEKIIRRRFVLETLS